MDKYDVARGANLGGGKYFEYKIKIGAVITFLIGLIFIGLSVYNLFSGDSGESGLLAIVGIIVIIVSFGAWWLGNKFRKSTEKFDKLYKKNNNLNV